MQVERRIWSDIRIETLCMNDTLSLEHNFMENNREKTVIRTSVNCRYRSKIYIRKKGKDVNSDSLIASGSDAFNDALLSISVAISAIIFVVFNISLEAYVSVILSLFIIKSGLELIKESVDNILGVRIESDLSKKIKE